MYFHKLFKIKNIHDILYKNIYSQSKLTLINIIKGCNGTCSSLDWTVIWWMAVSGNYATSPIFTLLLKIISLFMSSQNYLKLIKLHKKLYM